MQCIMDHSISTSFKQGDGGTVIVAAKMLIHVVQRQVIMSLNIRRARGPLGWRMHILGNLDG